MDQNFSLILFPECINICVKVFHVEVFVCAGMQSVKLASIVTLCYHFWCKFLNQFHQHLLQ